MKHAAASAFLAFTMAVPALAGPPSIQLNPNEALAFWTLEKAATAQPMPWRIAQSDNSADLPTESLAALDSQSVADFAAHAPTDAVPPDFNARLISSTIVSARSTSATPITGTDLGSSKAYFSSTRLLPLEADLFYPYRAIGKLLFEIPGKGVSTCSASVVSRRLILTAGHCVHSGTTSPGFYTKFIFVPAYRDGASPYAVWPGAAVWVTSTWATGAGKLPNAADYAIIELADVTFSDSVTRRVGDVTGWFGVQLAGLKANHVHILGYPGNLDNGEKMHQVTSSTYKFDTKTNTGMYGSDMMQGSSGGPWIQNFGLPATGQSVTGGLGAMNRVVGVTSFGSTSPLPKAANSSMLDARLTTILNAACSNKSGNCS